MGRRTGARYDDAVDGQKSDRNLIILLWVLGLTFMAFVLLAGIAGLTPEPQPSPGNRPGTALSSGACLATTGRVPGPLQGSQHDRS